MIAKVSRAQRLALFWLSGDKRNGRLPRTVQAKEMVVRALIGRELINPVGWTLTEAGRLALKESSNADQ